MLCSTAVAIVNNNVTAVFRVYLIRGGKKNIAIYFRLRTLFVKIVRYFFFLFDANETSGFK